jgi:bifunctional DNase/RNase
MIYLLTALGAQLERVVITELRTATYYAEMQVRRGADLSAISCRPSDAVAVAVRTGSPLFVDDDLMDGEGIMLPIEEDDGDGSNSEEIVGQFRQFLDSIRPEDFGS